MLYVFSKDVDRCPATAGGEVRWRPEHAFPIASSQVGSFLSKHTTGNTLQRVHQIGDSNLGRILHQQMNVMVFTVHLDEFALEVDTDLRKHQSQSVDSVSVRYPIPIFRDED
jgi:hypothetical protein